MDAIDRYVIKVALQTVDAAGGAGVMKTALLSQIDLAAGTPTTDEQRENAFSLLRGRGWIAWHFEPILHEQRWTITERGKTALEAM